MTNAAATPHPALKRRACPICGRNVSADPGSAYPFCSERCADVDLHRWLSGAYVVAGDDGGAGPDPDEKRDETAE